MTPELLTRLDDIARTPVLLVATDYDGTLAPIVSEPERAESHRQSVVALKSLAALPQTHVAVISGRALADLARHLAEAEDAHLVGSHGSEFEAGFAAPISPAAVALLRRTIETAENLAARTPGTRIEKKPASVAFHYRNAAPDTGPAAADELLRLLSSESALHVRRGKMVVELSVVKTNKGQALQGFRQRLGASAVLFMGDDITDEDAFATLSGPDLGIKVGDGPTAARFRVDGTLEVARLLARLAEARAAWLAGAEAVPIEEHSLLSDQRTCALVDPRGRIAWLCVPRIDSPALFAEILGGAGAGFFEIRPADDSPAPPRQQYLGPTCLLQTDWGDLRVIDYLDCAAGRPFQRAGRTDLLRVIEGRGRARITYAPRLNFGTLETRLRASPAGVEIDGAIDPCVLYAPDLRWTISREGRHDTAIAEVELGTNPVLLELRYGTANLSAAALPEPRRREQTHRFWSLWAATLKLPPLYSGQVLRSAIALRALVYGPTGAIAAAATTSLPESPGGVRNWDYRFCWPRDAAIAASALLRLQSPGTAMKLLDWFLALLDGTPPGTLIRPVYSVTGGHLGAEGVIAELTGYRGSRPVRTGNMAAHQIQLDVLGPVAELLALKARHGAALTPEHWRLTESMVAAVANRWTEADHGIWEIRDNRKHHVHSKVMCWQTVDCALRVADYMGHRRDAWGELRQTIAADILAHAWNAQRQAFCECYGGNQIDAASLWVGLSGLLPPDDPRVISTVQAVETELLDGPAVYRYKYDDGLPGIEGAFNICTTWLIESYILLGRLTDARELLDRYVALAGPTGLIAEEFDPKTRQSLGNFPQAYSHAGLINAAVRLANATQPHQQS